MKPSDQLPDAESIRAIAAQWAVRRDRGLSATESVEFELWLAADPAHAAAMARSSAVWSRLDHLSDHVAQDTIRQASRRRSFWRRTVIISSLAAAAAITIVLVSARKTLTIPQAAADFVNQTAESPRGVTLSDGSFVQLNANSEVIERFAPAERRVLLTRGEAHFSVTKNAARPFIVRAGNIEVRAVGTAFDVQLQSAAVEVLVTEGVVKVNPAGGAPDAGERGDRISALSAGERAVIPFAPASASAAVLVNTVNQEEISSRLAWQAPLLRLSGATLAEVAANFERHTGRRVILRDPELANLRLGGRFRADDLEGFVSLLATTLEVEVDRTPDGVLELRKKTPNRDSGK